MLTIFSTAKPFRGHSDIIQRNALCSWKLLHPDVEVILFGDDDGAANVCRQLGIRHEPEVRRNENSTKYLNHIFDRAYQCSRHAILCYANCDIMFGPDFLVALQIVSKLRHHFLMIGRRWDTDIKEAWNFSEPSWDSQLRQLAQLRGKQNGPSWVDYFCFSRDLYYRKMPPFLIGRHGWDMWLTYFARKSRVSVIDASRAVVAVHQNHDYAYLKQGATTEHATAEVRHNFSLGDRSAWHFYSVDAATDILMPPGRLEANRLSWLGPIKARTVYTSYRIWFAFLKATRPLRHRLGLRSRLSKKEV